MSRQKRQRQHNQIEFIFTMHFDFYIALSGRNLKISHKNSSLIWKSSVVELI